MIKPILTILIGSLLISASCQEYSCSIEYKHMTGNLDGKTAIVDLIITNNEIRGSCLFPEIQYEEGPYAGMVRTEHFEGNIDEHGIASITANTQNIEAGEYSGEFGAIFKGTFRDAHSGKTGSFSFEEGYPDGSVPFKGLCLIKDSVLFDSAYSPFAHLDLSMLIPMNEPDLELVRKAVIKTFLGEEIQRSITDDSLLHYFGMEYFGKYVNANKDLYDGGMSFNWEIINNSAIGMNHNGILVYRANSYGYTGGAHGMGISRFLVFDTYEMKEIKLEDILIPGYEDELSKMLERNYRLSNYLGPEQSLVEAGLFENYIPPSNNFFLTENSIGFYYNPYKIAPYTMGAQLISLTYEEVAPLLQEGSPVGRFLK